MGAAFTFERVTVRYRDAVVLRDLSVTLPGAGITVIVGASGAGKSTLLRCCNRLEVPSEGTVRFAGEDLATVDPLMHRRRVAMVFQTPIVFPGTVADNLRAGAPVLTEAAAARLLERVGLEAAAGARTADTLSGGEAQRVVLARALATEPVALLADEPTSALDERATQRLEDLAIRLAGDGMPIVWVTHDLHQAQRLAQHLVVLDHGAVTWSGEAGDPAAPAALAGLARIDEDDVDEDDVGEDDGGR